MKTFGIATINYKRRQVLKLWLAQITRLKTDLDMHIPCVVVSGEEDKDLCAQHGVWHITYKNRPVHEKFNRAYEYMKSIDVDYVILSGSDDIMSTDTLRNIMVEMEKGTDLIGVTTLYFYAGDGRDRGKLVKLTHRNILAPAKTVSKRVLDICDWYLWRPYKDEGHNAGLDQLMTKTIRPHCKTKKAVEGFVVDVKTRECQMNRFNIWGNRLPEVNPQEFYNILSDKELEILKRL